MADPWHIPPPTTSTRPLTQPNDNHSSLTGKPTTRPTIRPVTATNATASTVLEDANFPVLMQPDSTFNAEQDLPASSPSTTVTGQSTSTPTWVIVIAVIALATVGGIVAFVVMKKR